MKQFLTIILACTAFVGYSQNLRESNVSTFALDSSAISYESTQGKAFVFLNNMNGDFRVRFDLNTFVTGDKDLDQLLNSYAGAELLFRGNTGMSQYNFEESRNNDKVYPINGTLSYQGKVIPINAIFDPIHFSGAYSGPNTDMKVNFKITIDPSQMYILGFSDLNYRAVTFEVAPGLVNPITN